MRADISYSSEPKGWNHRKDVKILTELKIWKEEGNSEGFKREFQILHEDAFQCNYPMQKYLQKTQSFCYIKKHSHRASSWQIREAVGRWALDNESKRAVRWREKKWRREEKCDEKPEQLLPVVCLYLSSLCSASLDTLRPKTTWRLMVTFNQAEVASLCARRRLCACCSRWRGTYSTGCEKVFVRVCGKRWMLNLKSLEDEQGFN